MKNTNELKQHLINLWKNTELESYTDSIETALKNYDGDNDAYDFISWFAEEYIYSADIIYYSNAMEFLTKYDISLHDSMAKASEMGYTPDQLNSEVLASLLLQDILTDELYGFKDELTEYFESIEE